MSTESECDSEDRVDNEDRVYACKKNVAEECSQELPYQMIDKMLGRKSFTSPLHEQCFPFFLLY